jgi:hypothetical protein
MTFIETSMRVERTDPGAANAAPGKRPVKRSDNPHRHRPAQRKKHGALKSLWLAYKAIYYASTPSWRFMKSGALFLFGFFCWSAGNLLLSYEPSWTWVQFIAAYGFLVIIWGPVTHLLLVPIVTPFLRRHFRWNPAKWMSKHLSLLNFLIFLVHVILFGLYPPDHVLFEFGSIAREHPTVDVNPTLDCSRDRSAALLSCTVTPADGIGRLEIETAGEPLLQLAEAPWSFTLQEQDLVRVVGQQQFEVLVMTPDSSVIRSFTKYVATIP